MTRLLLIGVGGFLGSVARYLVSGVVQTTMHSETFPYGTLVVNVVGCFVIGAVSHLSESHGAFTADIEARCEEPPVATEVTLVGSYQVAG